MPSFRSTNRRLVFVLVSALFSSLLVWSVGIEPRWVAAREISLNQLKSSDLKGLKVAFASDWHFTKKPIWRVMTVARARAIVKEINDTQPDVIILAGDFIADRDYKPEFAATAEDEIASVLGELKARHGVYATLGNHDWWFDGLKFTLALQRHGIKVLENESVKIQDLPLWLSGIGDEMTGHARPNKAVKTVPPNAPQLVVMHDPAGILTLDPRWHNPNALFLAGHTHGGQVALPWFGALMTASIAPRSWYYGWVQHEGRNLYISSGLGVSILPLRFNMRPEWVLFTVAE
jgi:uncharacterized protein